MTPAATARDTDIGASENSTETQKLVRLENLRVSLIIFPIFLIAT